MAHGEDENIEPEEVVEEEACWKEEDDSEYDPDPQESTDEEEHANIYLSIYTYIDRWMDWFNKMAKWSWSR